MEFELAYWHWIVLGVVLVLSEIMLTTFFVLWFGVAALVMALVLLVLPALALGWQVFIWTLLSIALAVLWFRYLKPLAVDRTMAGMSREAIIGETGQVISAPTGERRGQLRFPAPILGADEWLIISTDSLAVGDRVRVKDFSGNALIVEKV